MIQFVGDVVIFLVRELFGRHAWPWWTLVGVFAVAAVWWRSWPFAVASLIMVALRMTFAWLEKQARTPLIDRPPGPRQRE